MLSRGLTGAARCQAARARSRALDRAAAPAFRERSILQRCSAESPDPRQPIFQQIGCQGGQSASTQCERLKGSASVIEADIHMCCFFVPFPSPGPRQLKQPSSGREDRRDGGAVAGRRHGGAHAAGCITCRCCACSIERVKRVNGHHYALGHRGRQIHDESGQRAATTSSSSSSSRWRWQPDGHGGVA